MCRVRPVANLSVIPRPGPNYVLMLVDDHKHDHLASVSIEDDLKFASLQSSSKSEAPPRRRMSMIDDDDAEDPSFSIEERGNVRPKIFFGSPAVLHRT